MKSPARTWLAIFFVATALAYSSAISAPFEYDDIPAIEQNTTIQRLLPLAGPLEPPAATPVSGRPAVNLSLAFNYAINDLFGVDQRPDPDGPYKTVSYHIVNLLLHLLCGALIFGLIRRTLRSAVPEGSWIDPDFVAGFATLLWLLDPIQTEAVDYVIQRTELMVSVCYAATLYASIRAWDAASARNRRFWYAAAIVTAIIGMESKEVMVTAPLMVLLYDRAFRAQSWGALRERVGFYVALFATSLIVIVTALTGARGESVGFDLGVTWYQYLYTQGWAIAHYLRLMFWPSGLTFDYGEQPVGGFRAIPGLVLLVACGAATIFAFTRRRWIGLGFAGIWFFLLLAPSSSVVPIKTEIAAERRVYLASVVVFVLVVLGVEWLRRRISLRPVASCVALGIVAAMLGVVTFGRGLTYASPEILYRDTIDKAPFNPRAFVSLGLAVVQEGAPHFDEAVSLFHQALDIDSSDVVAWRSLGVVESMRGDWRDAVVDYDHVVRARPDNIDANDGMARALLRLDQPDAAKPYIEKVAGADMELLWTMGDILVQRGRGPEALRYLEPAAGRGAPPSLGVALLSVAYAQSARIDEAVNAAAAAASAAGDTANVFVVAGRAMIIARRPTEARKYLERALALDPSLQAVRAALATLDRH